MSAWLRLATCLALPQLVGVAAAAATAEGVREWYPTLDKPPFTPPDAVFPPVWFLLYLLMGVAAYRVWRGGLQRPGVRAALGLFLVQLALNGLWSILFFGLHRIGAALAEIVALWVAVTLTMRLFWRQARSAGLLLLPYWAWVGFAVVLNFSIWRLNP